MILSSLVLVPSLSVCAARASYAKAQVGRRVCSAAFAALPHPNPSPEGEGLTVLPRSRTAG